MEDVLPSASTTKKRETIEHFIQLVNITSVCSVRYALLMVKDVSQTSETETLSYALDSDLDQRSQCCEIEFILKQRELHAPRKLIWKIAKRARNKTLEKWDLLERMLSQEMSGQLLESWQAHQKRTRSVVESIISGPRPALRFALAPRTFWYWRGGPSSSLRGLGPLLRQKVTPTETRWEPPCGEHTLFTVIVFLSAVWYFPDDGIPWEWFSEAFDPPPFLNDYEYVRELGQGVLCVSRGRALVCIQHHVRAAVLREHMDLLTDTLRSLIDSFGKMLSDKLPATRRHELQVREAEWVALRDRQQAPKWLLVDRAVSRILSERPSSELHPRFGSLTATAATLILVAVWSFPGSWQHGRKFVGPGADNMVFDLTDLDLVEVVEGDNRATVDARDAVYSRLPRLLDATLNKFLRDFEDFLADEGHQRDNSYQVCRRRLEQAREFASYNIWADATDD